MNTIYGDIVKSLEANEDLVAVTIFNMTGSTPRSSGAKMLVRADGSIAGTIGGGKLESEARKWAVEAMKTKTSTARSFDLTGADAAEMDMICGGIGELFLDYISAGNSESLALYRTVAELQLRNEKAWMVTNLSSLVPGSKKKQQCLLKKDLSRVGEIAVKNEDLAELVRSSSSAKIHVKNHEGQTLLIEPVRGPCTAYIFGAGHIAQKFAVLAEWVGFRTVVLDDRSDYANPARFPSSEIIVLESFEAPLPDLPWDEDSYLVVVTRGHLHDKTVLQQIIRKPVAYLGMIGSIMKRTILYQALAEEFGYTEEDFARIHSPIGLEIKAESPEEIAVSMAAELILVRAGREE